MSSVDTRQIGRDSLFLMAELKLAGQDRRYRVRVRNLSAGGMMAEGDPKVMRGALVTVELRNIGPVDGSVAWVQDNRFGIAFADEIDPQRVRDLPKEDGNHLTRIVRRPTRAADRDRSGPLRKI